MKIKKSTKKPTLILTPRVKPNLVLTRRSTPKIPIGGYNPYHVGKKSKAKK